MSSRIQHKEQPVALSLQRRVDAVCLRYEKAWQANQRPVLDDFLGDTPEPERTVLRRELMALEMAYRQRAGENREPEYAATLEPPDPQLFLLTQPASHEEPQPASHQVPPTAAPTLPADRVAAFDHAAMPGYEILGVLGRGGMGVVYKARQRVLNRIVAIKMILAGAHAGPEELARFRREAATIARLHHPHIVQIYEVGEQNGQPFCALEFVEGGSLARKLAGRPQPARAAAQTVEALARAIHAAHQAGIIHRDLKPANVLLTADGTPKITDFGLAKQLDEDLWRTHSDIIMGTPSYMAPEQAAGKRRIIGPHIDVYSLGAVLYEMLTGRPPFLAATAMELLVQVRIQEPVPPSRLQPKVPRDLETICLKCLEKDRHRRYPSALALAEDVHRFLANEPIRARPVRVWERGLKWAKRRPVAAALAVVSSLAVLILIVSVFAILYMHEQEQRRDRELTTLQKLRSQALKTLKDQAEEFFATGRAHVDAQRWPDAKDALNKALVKIELEPSLADLRERVQSLLGVVNGILAELDHLREFRTLRDKALFHATLATGEGRQANLDATQKAGWNALHLFGVTVDVPGPLLLKDHFTGAEKTEIMAGCYELLVILAEAEVMQPQPHAQQALRMMDRAAGLEWRGHPTHAYYLRRARYLDLLGDHTRAGEEREKAQSRPPTTALDYYLVGDEYYKLGDVAKAIEAFERALELQPDHFWARYFLSVSYLRPERSHPDLAKAHLTTCLIQRPDLVWLYLLRGFAHTKLNDFEAADNDFANALRRSPGPDARHGLYANRGYLRLQQGRFEDAVADLQEAIKLKPNEYAVYVTLAQVYQSQKRWDEAVQQLTEAIRLAPELAFLYRLRALLYVHRPDQNLSAALKDTERAIEVEQRAGDSATLAACYTEKGRILYLSEKYLDAVTACNQALKKDPTHANAHLLRAEALLKQLQFEEAADSFDQYQTNGGRVSFEFYRGRGLARAQCKKYPEAIDDYRRALEIKPDDSLYAARGWAYLATGADKLALRDFRLAIERNPKNADAYCGRGYARVHLGQYVEAVEDAEEALNRGPKNGRLVYDAARIYAQAAGKAGHRQALAQTYQHRAVSLLRQCLDSHPPKERGPFWRDKVLPDGALSPIAGSTEFLRLRAEYAQWAK